MSEYGQPPGERFKFKPEVKGEDKNFYERECETKVIGFDRKEMAVALKEAGCQESISSRRVNDERLELPENRASINRVLSSDIAMNKRSEAVLGDIFRQLGYTWGNVRMSSDVIVLAEGPTQGYANKYKGNSLRFRTEQPLNEKDSKLKYFLMLKDAIEIKDEVKVRNEWKAEINPNYIKNLKDFFAQNGFKLAMHSEKNRVTFKLEIDGETVTFDLDELPIIGRRHWFGKKKNAVLEVEANDIDLVTKAWKRVLLKYDKIGGKIKPIKIQPWTTRQLYTEMGITPEQMEDMTFGDEYSKYTYK